MSDAPPGWGCTSCSGRNPGGTRFCGHCGGPRTGVDVSTDLGLASALERVPDSVSARRADELGDGGERRLVTSLFADISGFTTLADTLEDPEELHEVIAPVIAGMAAIAETYEGFIAKYAGDALLVFFGAPVAHEDDAARALNVALEMHEALPGLVEQLGPAARGLELHIGVNTGRVISGRYGGEERSDYSILGDAVIIAQRLESIAPNGETYVGAATQALAGENFDFEYLGELTVKGKPRPVPAWRLLGRLDAEVVVPVALGTPFVGRRGELDRLVTALGHPGGAAIVEGEPGVGKSRLVDEVRGVLEDRGARWLQARNVSYGSALTYFPYAGLVRQVLGIPVEEPPSVAGERLRTHPTVSAAVAPYLARLIGAEWPGADLQTPAAFGAGVSGAIVDWIARVAADSPVVVVLEDVHWTDAGSVQVTAHLAERAGAINTSLLVTTRPEGRSAADFACGDGPEEHVLLAPLDRHDVAELVETILGGAPPAVLVDTVATRTAGNPLFATEMVRSLVDDGDVHQRHGHWTMRAGWSPQAVPSSIERVLAARVDRLPPCVASVLQTASVVGRLVRLPLLDAVIEVGDVGPVLDELIAGGFLVPTRDAGEEALQFHHALLQEVAYERMMRKNRKEIHARVAAAAERLYGSGDDVIELLARHLFLAEAPGEIVVPHLLRAADRTKRLFANDAAIGHLQRALSIASDDDRFADATWDIRLDLAELQDIRGDYDDALESYRAARSRTGGCRAWQGEAAVLRRLGRYEEALEVVDLAFAHVDPDGFDAAALWLERGTTLCVATRNPEARVALHAGLTSVGRVDHGVVGRLLAQLGEVERMEGELDVALRHAAESEAMFERLGDVLGLTWAERVVGAVEYSRGRLDAAVSAWRRAVELAERVGAAEEAAGGLLNLGLVEMERGNLADGIDCDRRAVTEFERLGHGSGRAVAYGNLAEKLLLADEPGEAWVYAHIALTHATAIDHAETIADVHYTMARLHLRAGRHREAAEAAEQAAAKFLAAGLHDRASLCRAITEEAQPSFGSAGG